MVSKYTNGEIEITVIPTPGAVVSTKELMKGNVEGSYTADVQLREIRPWTGRFEDFRSECKTIPLQFLWLATLEIGIAIPEKHAGEITKWSDLSDKPVFTLPLIWDVGTRLREGLDALGVKYKHVELDLGMVGTALVKGDIVATGIYTSAGGAGTAPWILEMELSAPPLVVLNPSPDEIDKVIKAGVPIVEIPADKFQKIFKRIKIPAGQDRFVAVTLYYSFALAPSVPEDVAYRLIKLVSEHIKELAELDKYYAQLAEDFDGFLVRAIDANKDWPVHPGLVKYLKERGLWKDYWVEGTPENVEKFMKEVLKCPVS